MGIVTSVLIRSGKILFSGTTIKGTRIFSVKYPLFITVRELLNCDKVLKRMVYIFQWINKIHKSKPINGASCSEAG
jgi:hypothetical protein